MLYSKLLVLLYLLFLHCIESFETPNYQLCRLHRTLLPSQKTGLDFSTGSRDVDDSGSFSSRRSLLQSLVAFPLFFSVDSRAAETSKILVLGGTGFVGSRVVQLLRERGVDVVATSTNGREGTIALDLTANDAASRLQTLASGSLAVISCVGAIGTPNDQAINAGTATAAAAAKAAGVRRFVYITVAPEVQEFARGLDFMEGYMAGKATSRRAVLEYFPGERSTLIEPTFIYGGGSFELNPPRVPSFYGKFIEGLLSSSPLRTAERIVSPGILKIALEPPVPVEDVARAAVAGALGTSNEYILDSYDKIKAASATFK